MVLFNQVRVGVSVGSIFVKNPNLAIFGPFLMSFFEFGRRILKILIPDEVNPPIQNCPNSVAKGHSTLSARILIRICESVIDTFTPQTFLIVDAISQQIDWMRNGRRKKLL